MATTEMACFCFDVLHAELSPLGARNAVPVAAFEDGCNPLFVTWEKETPLPRGGAELNLRGCIGNLSPIPLRSGLRDYAINSAFRDRRFPPVKPNELSCLHCSVTLLSNFQPAESWDDWEIGRHGLSIEFVDQSNNQYCATYLPSVCAEQGWSKEECVDSLIRKAGYKLAISPKLRQMLRVTRYEVCLGADI